MTSTEDGDAVIVCSVHAHRDWDEVVLAQAEASNHANAQPGSSDSLYQPWWALYFPVTYGLQVMKPAGSEPTGALSKSGSGLYCGLCEGARMA